MITPVCGLLDNRHSAARLPVQQLKEGSMTAETQALVGIIMGSKSDYEQMSAAVEILNELKVSHEIRVLSAHRTPEETLKYSSSAAQRGLKVIIAGAGGAAHLAGITASKTILPVIGVPIQTSALGGMDSLLSTAQMPRGVPVATMAIGKAGAGNAALLAAEIIALSDAALADRLTKWRANRAAELLAQTLP
jgi:5-(carboxyamino)imidazole ribonucleotide mutase